MRIFPVSSTYLTTDIYGKSSPHEMKEKTVKEKSNEETYHTWVKTQFPY